MVKILVLIGQGGCVSDLLCDNKAPKAGIWDLFWLGLGVAKSLCLANANHLDQNHVLMNTTMDGECKNICKHWSKQRNIVLRVEL